MSQAASDNTSQTLVGAGAPAGDDLGYRRALSPFAAWAFSFGCVVGWGSFLLPGTTFLPKAGPLGTVLGIAAGFAVMLIIALSIGYVAKRYPGPGGIFSFVKAVFGPNQAFVCAWFLLLVYFTLVASNATAVGLVLRNVVGSLFQVGPHYAVAGFEVYLGEVALAIAVIALIAGVCVRGVKLTAFVQMAFALGIVVIVFAVVMASVASPEVTVESFKPLFSPDVSPALGVMAVFSVMPFAFVGFESVALTLGESRFASSKLARIMVLSIVAGALTYLAIALLAAVCVPAGFSSWVEYVQAAPSLEGFHEYPSFAAADVVLGRAGVALMVAAALCAALSGVLGFTYATSRLMAVMAREGALPERIGRLHGRFRTPVVAILVIAGFSCILPLAGRTALGWVVDMSSVGAALAYAYTSYAVVRVEREEDAQGDGRRARLARVLGMLGAVASVVFLVLLLVPIPVLDVSLGKESYIMLVTWIALGVNYYTPQVG